MRNSSAAKGRALALLLVFLGVVGFVPSVAHAASAQTVLRATLSGAQAVPTGDPDGGGEAIVVVRPDNLVCFRIIATRIESILAIHIHEAPPGQKGPHAVDLDGRLVTMGGGDQVFVGCVDGGAKASELAASPTGYYVNVHTDAYIAGALRGQLARLGGT